MKKPLTFDKLNEDAKRQAASEVYELEAGNLDLTPECEMLTEGLEEKLKENNINIGSNGWSWDNNYGVSIDLSGATISNDFWEKNLTKEELELFEDIDELTGGHIEHHIFNKEYTQDGYEMVFDYSFQWDQEEVLEFWMKYSNDQEKYAFVQLLNEELEDEKRDQLQDDVFELAEEKMQTLADKASEIISNVYQYIYDSIRENVDYWESDAYFFDRLNCDLSYEYENYHFSEEGNIVAVEGEIGDEFSEEYSFNTK